MLKVERRCRTDAGSRGFSIVPEAFHLGMSYWLPHLSLRFYIDNGMQVMEFVRRFFCIYILFNRNASMGDPPETGL